MMNRINPCRDCGLKEKDKSNATCRNCKKRGNYLRRLSCDLEFSATMAVDHWYPLHLPH